MIRLQQSIINKIALTLSEKEVSGYTGPDYNLYLTNCQTNEITTAVIQDISLFPSRYNEFEVKLDTILEQMSISTNTLLSQGKTYFVSGDISIERGATLVIPSYTYIVKSPTSVIRNSGTITNSSHIVSNSNLSSLTKSLKLGTTPPDTKTYLFDYAPGYYDYEVKTEDNSIILEIGKIYIDPVTETVTTYTEEPTKYVYNG